LRVFEIHYSVSNDQAKSFAVRASFVSSVVN